VAQVTKTKPKPRTTPEERKAKLDALRERLKAWYAEHGYTEDEANSKTGWPSHLAAAAARWDGYSPRNAHLIAMQRPEATDVRGYREWLAHGRQVRKGEQGIQILAPVTKKGEDGDGELIGVRIAYVFDVSQTDPVEAA
jgi:hypothetical protein